MRVKINVQSSSNSPPPRIRKEQMALPCLLDIKPPTEIFVGSRGDTARKQGKWDVKYELLESGSKTKHSTKNIWVLKIFFLSCILFVVFCIIFIYLEDYFKATFTKQIGQAHESKVSDQPNPPPSTHLPLEQTTHIHHTSTSPPSPNACGVQVKDGPLIKVDHHNTYVIGSYLDHRLREKQIKSIAIVLRHEPATYSCVMCCDGRIVTSNAQCSIHSDHFNYDYGAATITCPISSRCLTPTHVAITAGGVSGRVTSFQSVRNRDVPTTFPYDFTVCHCVMYDYKNVLMLVESIEMSRLLGAQRVVIYKTNCDSDTQKVLDYYEKSGFVEIIPWTIKNHINVSKGWKIDIAPGQLQYYGQIPALNDCVFRYMYQTRYLALQDMDEFILPIKEKTWRELFPLLEHLYGTDVGFEFENNQFPMTAKLHLEHNVEAWKHVKGINILNYIEREPINPSAFNNYKVIVNPRLVQKVTVHGLLETANGKPTVRVNKDIARMYHFKNYTFPPNTNLITDSHLWDYTNKLEPAVSEVLQDCGLLKPR
ncbi:uncharacterized protein LOC127933795 isoform X2 [Carassius gibelio]|uniref:uncharacterized protein LOC127933795 isoform X2 n=1 Tax=Carassius gibelio TaxID=101364 RepID=UPI0022792A57|nr:uncharacterized protein LOC127933795 isoform X2 [Carassius gibelio]XP_052386744.1 uncharacterized protein LOC127933795 isoform X2 [Carassius gibelio]